MLIKIGDFEFTEVWDGAFYKKLSAYPKILQKVKADEISSAFCV